MEKISTVTSFSKGVKTILKGVSKVVPDKKATTIGKYILGAGGVGVAGGLAANYFIDDGHDKSDHGRKKTAELNKEGFDVATERGVVWTNRGKGGVENNLNYLEKKVGKKGKIQYFVTQDSKVPRDTTLKKDYKPTVDTVENVRKKIFKNWDNTKGSFGEFYKAGEGMTPKEKADQKYAIDDGHDKKDHGRKKTAFYSKKQIETATTNIIKNRFGKKVTNQTTLKDLKLDDLDMAQGIMSLEDKLKLKVPLSEDIIWDDKKKYNSKKLGDLVNHLYKHQFIKKGFTVKVGEDMTPKEKADQKYAIAKSYEREGHPRKANEYKSKASRAYKHAYKKIAHHVWEKRAWLLTREGNFMSGPSQIMRNFRNINEIPKDKRHIIDAAYGNDISKEIKEIKLKSKSK